MKKPMTRQAKFAVASLVCGISAIAYPACITGPIGSVAAIILGILGVKSEKRGLAITGIVLAGLSLALFAILTYLEYRNRTMLEEILQPSSAPQETFGSPNPTQIALDSGQPYYNKEHEFSVTFPANWTIKGSGARDTIIKAVFRDFQNRLAQISIAAYLLPSEFTTEDKYALTPDVMWEGLTEQFPDFTHRRLDSGYAHLRSRRVVWNTVEIAAPPQAAMFAKHYHFIKDSHLYRVTAMTDHDSSFFHSTLPEMDASIATLAFGM